ncbi:MAG: hypothetical protein M3179_02230 [Actinomycetota bacterium]|nr:hypothetical protein [Actinomycetota bacterium]
MNDLRHRPVRIAEPPEVDGGALSEPTEVIRRPATVRRRSVIVGVAVTVVMTVLAGGGVWWQRTVTGNPGLEFYGGPNVYRDEATTDRGGIHEKHNMLGDEVDIDFTANGRLYAHFGLYNGGHHDIRIEGAPDSRDYYWCFDRMSLSADPDDGFVGVAARYEPFRPFTLRPGETREVRLEFRLADCNPASLQPGGYSTRRGLSVRYRILGITRTVDVPFRDSVLALQAMGICEHPIVEQES